MKEPGIRIVDGRRIDLVELRKRKAAQGLEPPIEDMRVVRVWERAANKDASRVLDKAEAASIKRLPAKIETVSKKVPNPHFSMDHAEDSLGNYKEISASKNVRESAITALSVRGLIDAAQLKAAHRFLAAWEILGGAGAKAIDYSVTRVDGGGVAEPMNLRKIQAWQDVSAAKDALVDEYGLYAYRTVCYIVGEGHSVYDLTETRRQRDTLTDNLRSYLDVLAGIWGQGAKGSVRYRNDLTSRA